MRGCQAEDSMERRTPRSADSGKGNITVCTLGSSLQTTTECAQGG